MYPPSRNFWVLCEINVIDNPGHVSTPCRDLIVGINHYNDSDTILALGGSFGCFPSKFPDELSESACVPDYRMDAVLSDCLSCTHMGVCILEPPPK
jgi:malate dehydrogenase (oxaloacetate-decarboxylating)(NADP+)